MKTKLIYTLSLLIGIIFNFSTIYAQSYITISGKVKDKKDNSEMPGVSVILKGTDVGVISELDGSFTIQIPKTNEKPILVFTFIGYQNLETPVENKTVINVEMESSVESISEAVVVGYGVQAKKDITGSVAVIKSEDLQQIPSSNFGDQIQGKAAGVQIQSTGFAGAGTSMRIRGIGSVNDNGPLFIIDGVSTTNQDINSINPNDIESIQILKDASSAAIYGAQASGGVVIINTKKGRKGENRANISYNAYYGIKNPVKFHDLMNTQQYADYLWTRQLNGIKIRDLKNEDGSPKIPTHPQFGTGPTPVIPDYIIPAGYIGSNPGEWTPTHRVARISPGTDWWKGITRTGETQNHQLSVTGAGETGRYAMSANYYDEKGVMIGEFYKRYSLRANSEYNIRKHIRVGENLSVSYSEMSFRGNQDEGSPLSFAYRMVPFVPIYDVNGMFAGTGAEGSGNGNNPVAMVRRSQDDRNFDTRLIGNVYAEIDLLRNFTFRTSFGVDYKYGTAYWMEKKQPERSEPVKDNKYTENGNYNIRWVFTNTLTYEKTFAEKHYLKVLLGTEAVKDGIGRSWEASRKGYFQQDNTDTWTLDNGTFDVRNSSKFNGKYALLGYFARLDYYYDQRYLLTANIRRDGVSRFISDQRWGTFVALSGGWRISQEEFMKDIEWLSDLKLRVGYGTTGNADIPRPFNYAYEYGQNLSFGYDLAGTSTSTISGIQLSKFGNVRTRWEKSQMTNFGVDLAIFRNALTFNIEYYIKKTNDMLVQDTHSAFSGIGDAPYVNIGEMKNTGIDFGLTYRGKIRKDFNWEVSGTISGYKNKVISLKDEDEYFRMWGAGSRIGDLAVTQAGFPISMFYGYKIDGIFQNEAEVMSAAKQNGMVYNNKGERIKPELMVGKYRYADINNDKIIDQNDKAQIGSPHPDFSYGLNLSVNYKNFDFSMYIYGEQGKEIFNFVKYWTDFNAFDGGKSTRILTNSWKKEGDIKATLPIIDDGDTYSSADPHTYYVENGSFMRVKNITLGYTIPFVSKIGINRLRIYFQLDNFFTITKYKGLDPEVPNVQRVQGGGGDLAKGIDFGNSPINRQYLFGININF